MIDLQSLNPQQREAAQTLHGPLLVLAGAGTGKTMVITCRIACLLQAGIKAQNILAVTFTNKAAREMRERAARMMPHLGKNELTVSTFHSFCCRVLRKDIGLLEYDRRFGIADDGDQDGVIKQVIGDLGIRNNEENSAQAFRIGISNAKNLMMNPQETRASSRNPWYHLLGDVYSAYQRHLKDMNLVDFDDLLLLTVQLWREHPKVLAEYQERFKYILVDEFQDTNQVQAEIVRLIAGKERNLCVVGDDDQSIYGWRGADVSNILGFPKAYAGAKVVKLEQNYRSNNVILKVANRIIANNADRHLKELWSAKPEGECIRLIACDTETDEGRLVGRMLQEQNVDQRVPYSDMAVLYRSKYQSRVLEQELRKLGVPYRIVGSKSFYEQREIKDAVAYLRIAHNERDDLSLLRILNVPPRGIGSKSIDALKQQKNELNMPMLAALRKQNGAEISATAASGVRDFVYACDKARRAFVEAGDLARKMEQYFRDTGYLDGLKKIYKNHEEALQRLENIHELINAAAEAEERRGVGMTLQDFLEEYSLTDDNDRVDEHAEEGYGATLMTVHAAKGLEFPIVIIAGMEDKLFPHERSIQEHNLDEERRLFYVAVTRAKERCFLTRAKVRTRFNGKLAQRPSRFLDEIPEELLVSESAAEALRPANADETQSFFEMMKDRYA